jgi:hypothetical protein
MKYRLADSATDYQLCKQLMAAEQFDDQDIDFPTIMALDDDNEVVGFLATTPNDEMVLAGPLVMRHDGLVPDYTAWLGSTLNHLLSRSTIRSDEEDVRTVLPTYPAVFV